MLKEIKKLVIGAVLTLSGAIMMTSEETIAVGMVVGIVGLLFLVISLFSGSKLASYYKEDSEAEQGTDHDAK